MHSPDPTYGFRSWAAASGDPPRLWGHDPVELHDHFWRQVGVQVVRPGTREDAAPDVGGSPAEPLRRPRAFLLLGLEELVGFGPASLLRRLRGARRRTMLVEIVDPEASSYAETISADESDALVSIERRYDAPRARGMVLLTRDRRIADWWRRHVHPARHPSAATAVDRVLARRRRSPLHGTAAGVLEDGSERGGVVRWFETMIRLDDALASTVPGVSLREPGVWVHESARIGANVSLAGPLWIGEHVVLEGNASLVGPRMLLDDTPRLGPVPGGVPVPRRVGHERAGAIADASATDARRSAGAAAPSGSLLSRLSARLRTGSRASAGTPGRGTRGRRPAAFIETRPLVPAAVRLPGGIVARPEPRSVRVFNVAVSALALSMVLPLFPLIMLAIWLEDGRPFFFGHVRQTRGGRNFTCWKFRTMCRDAERLKSQLERENVCDGPQFHIADDPRLLRIGRLLRRFHLDELPQLWNVLRGDMNLVGPRPSPDDENQFCPAWREARLSVKPGLTGLWQIRRTRAPMLDFQEWIRWDLEYVQRRSWRLDLWIMWRTAVSMLSRRGGQPTATTDPLPTAITGFTRPEGVAAIAEPAPESAPQPASSNAGRDLAFERHVASLGLGPEEIDAEANAEAVARRAAEERAATVARTTVEPAEAIAHEEDHGDAVTTGTDAGTEDAPGPHDGLGATVRGTEAPAVPPGPVQPAEGAGDSTDAPGAVEAKPRQPMRDESARGRQDVEAKPPATGPAATPDELGGERTAARPPREDDRDGDDAGGGGRRAA